MGKSKENVKKGLEKVTYATRGLMELQLHLPTGSKLLPVVEISFTGGQITGYGVAPARFTTDEPAFQHLIESTRLFREGKIFIEKRED